MESRFGKSVRGMKDILDNLVKQECVYQGELKGYLAMMTTSQSGYMIGSM